MLKIFRNIFTSNNGIRYLAYQQPNRYALNTLNKIDSVLKIEQVPRIENSSLGILGGLGKNAGLDLNVTGDKAEVTKVLIDAFKSARNVGTIHFD